MCRCWCQKVITVKTLNPFNWYYFGETSTGNFCKKHGPKIVTSGRNKESCVTSKLSKMTLQSAAHIFREFTMNDDAVRLL